MDALLLIFLGLVGIVSAQYSCTPGFCSQNNGLDRADVLGCLDFCYLDVDLDEFLHHSDLNTRYDEWRGTAEECDRDCFVTAHRAIFPACDSELNAGYDRLASKDEDNSTVSYDDVHLWYHVLMGIESGEPVGAAAFQTWFRGLYQLIGDETCTLPYP